MSNSAFPTSIPSSPAPPQSSTSRATSNGNSRLRAKPIPSSSFNAAVFDSTPPIMFSPPPTIAAPPSLVPSRPVHAIQPTQPILQPTRFSNMSRQGPQARIPSGGPNYNLALSPQPPAQPLHPSPIPSYSITPPSRPLHSTPPMTQPVHPAQPTVKPPPGWSSGLMQPTVPPKPAWGASAKGKQSLDDFDPLI